jgi:desulfoferrodoxin (superoxide reductase-like protein)
MPLNPRNTFEDPAGVVDDYLWQINHSDEDVFGRKRNVTESAKTGGTGLIKQQADSDPLVLTLTGSILHEAQHEQFIAWFELCETQSIFFTDFSDAKYEVVITEYLPVRKRTVKNPRDSTIPTWYYTYTLTMEVLSVKRGPWDGVTP